MIGPSRLCGLHAAFFNRRRNNVGRRPSCAPSGPMACAAFIICRHHVRQTHIEWQDCNGGPVRPFAWRLARPPALPPALPRHQYYIHKRIIPAKQVNQIWPWHGSVAGVKASPIWQMTPSAQLTIVPRRDAKYRCPAACH